MTPADSSRRSGAGHDTVCPPAETLAVYVDGRATPEAAAAIESHLGTCDDCLQVFAETTRLLRPDGQIKKNTFEPAPRWRPRFVIVGLSAAAAGLVAVAVLSRGDSSRGDLAASVARLESAAGTYRHFEPRLGAGEIHRPVAPATRSAAPSADPRAASRDELEAAASDVRAAAAETEHPEAARLALAILHFRLGDARAAVEALEPLAGSQDPQVISDVAAAYLARRAPGDSRRALELLERAVARDPACVEAWFNLGLAAEAEGQTARAIQAWTEAARIDAAPAWADEARWHLQKLTTR